MIRFALAFALASFTVTALSAEQAKLALKTEKLDPPKDLAEALKPEFGSEAFAISDGDVKLMSFWFRKEIPAKANAEQIKNGLTNREIPEGTLVGAVKLEKAFVDFRKQELPAGTYTLRIAVQPDTGDHKDTAPHQDFVLLSPVADDKSVEPVELKDLVRRSIKVTGSDHPAVMLLFPHFAKGDDAKLALKENGVTCLQLKRTVKVEDAKGSLGFAIVVAGFSKTR